MVRNLYRAYLYAVCVILLVAATTATAVSLGLLLATTPLRAPYSTPPDHSQVVQAVVAFVVVWLVTLTLGGLHYWLIRRDMATDPAAGGGAVRSYFLNITQLFAALIAIGDVAAGIVAMGDRNNTPIYYFSVALATAALFALLQWERQRTREMTSGAIILRLLHLYGAQLGIVFIATPLWVQAVYMSALTTFVRVGAFDPCRYYFGGPDCNPGAFYRPRELVAQWGAALFVAVCWAGYTAFSRSDLHSWLRQVTHLLAFGYGLGLVLWGSIQLFNLLLLLAVMRQQRAPSDMAVAASVLGTLAFGVVVMLAYGWLYAREAHGLPSGVPAARLIQVALVAVIFALPFWLGVRSLLSAVIEHSIPGTIYPNQFSDALSGAQALAGLPFIVFALLLGARTRQTGITWPHRVFVLVMLAGGVITSAGGLIVALQALLSAMLGAPADGWQYTARAGLATLLVGGTMVAIFVTLAARNRYLVARPEPKPVAKARDTTDTQPVAAMGTGKAPETLERILDALLAGGITRDEAAARIRAREGVR